MPASFSEKKIQEHLRLSEGPKAIRSRLLSCLDKPYCCNYGNILP